MKRRAVVLLTGTLTASMFLAGCQKNSEEENTTTIYGEVLEIDGDSITVALGEEPQTPEEEKGQKPSGDDTEQEKIITVDDDTTVEESSGGMGGGGPKDGQAPDGEVPDGEAPNGEAPDGEAPDGEAPDGKAPNGEAPDGEASDGQAPEMPEQETKEASISDLEEGDIVSVEMQGDKVVSITIQNMGMGGGDMSGSSTGSIELSGVYSVDGKEETSSDESYESTSADENTVLVTNEGTLTMSGAVLKKSGDTSSDDESNFYGVNAVLAAARGSEATIKDTTLESTSEGSNAIFATGEDSKITADNVKIHTTGNSSRGLDATYGGTVIATDVDITTEGAHCAPIATDRGEGTISVDSGTLSSAGEGSPCIYSTGEITARNLKGTATGSQAAVVEGKNSITLENCELAGAGENGIMLYQSTSGDAAEGTAEFMSTDSTISTTSEGPMFYITNTEAEAVLENTTLSFSGGILVRASGNDTNNWGKSGENGGDFTLKGVNQELAGDITCDEISTVAVELTKESSLKGTVNGDGQGKKVTISLDEDCTWEVTGDSYITSITDEDESLDNINSNGYTVYYDASDSQNDWLDGKTIDLNGGGTLAPME